MSEFNNLSKEAQGLWNEIMTGVNEKPIHKNPNNPKTKKILNRIKEIALINAAPTEVVFGTSGWRGIVGVSHTITNIARVTEAVVELVKTANKKLLKSIGVADFTDFQKRGVVVGRDNRILGEEFLETVIAILQKHKVKVYYAGETPTPEYSAAVLQLNAALSINLTPSHNPGAYAGYKLNPSDGGPAGEDITVPLEKIANKLMTRPIHIPRINWKNVKKIDTMKLYLKHINENIPDIINVNELIKFIKSGEIALAIDHIHGATRGRPKYFFKLTGKEKNIKILNNDDNVLFHGVKPEPNAKNLKDAEAFLNKSKCKYKLGALLDPDGDRIRFTNGKEQVDMNNFGALAFHFLALYKNSIGGVAKTVATSNFVNAIANGLKRPVFETNVGFKYFRPYLKPGAKQPAICAFEESDGFSIGYANILEKDAFGALMLAIEIIRLTKMDIVEYLKALKKSFGVYEAVKSSVDIPAELSKADKEAKIKKIADMYKIGDKIKLSDKIEKKVINKFPDDGIKFEFEDKSNLLIRASGTEPIIKIYAESPVSREDCVTINSYGTNLVKKVFG